MDKTWPAIPCGLVARSFFNDTYKLVFNPNELNNSVIDIDESGIAWQSDIKNSFKNLDDSVFKNLNLS